MTESLRVRFLRRSLGSKTWTTRLTSKLTNPATTAPKTSNQILSAESLMDAHIKTLGIRCSRRQRSHSDMSQSVKESLQNPRSKISVKNYMSYKWEARAD